MVIIADEKWSAALLVHRNYDDYGDDHTYKQITDDYTFSSHNENGQVLYVKFYKTWSIGLKAWAQVMMHT
jgi:hypothetical protein